MSQQFENDLIAISPQAVKAVSDILAEKKLDGYALRIYASAGGCCGMKFGMALDNQIAKEDTTIAAEGIRLVVDRASLEYLQGAVIDFIDDPQRGTGFTIDAPRANMRGGDCSCGSSCDCSN